MSLSVHRGDQRRMEDRVRIQGGRRVGWDTGVQNGCVFPREEKQGYTQPGSASMELGQPKAIASLCPASTVTEAESLGKAGLSLHFHPLFSTV